MRTGKRYDRLWRRIYVAEVILFAVPTLLPMGLLAVLGTLYCGGATLIGLGMLPGNFSGQYEDIEETMSFVVPGLLGTLVCLGALYAISRFVAFSRAYVFGSASDLAGHGREFRIAWAVSLVLLAINNTLVVIMPSVAPPVFLPLAIGNAVVMIPVLHLWLALRAAERSAGLRGATDTRMAKTGRSESRWRAVYMVEIIIVVLPVTVPMALLALIGTLQSLTLPLVGISIVMEESVGIYDGVLRAFSVLTIGAFILLASVNGVLALLKFWKLSRAYLLQPMQAFGAHSKEFRDGLRLAVAPLLATTGLAVVMLFINPATWPLVPLVSGAVLIIPVTHLWLALREAERATLSQTA